jgi:hypothetical protein
LSKQISTHTVRIKINLKKAKEIVLFKMQHRRVANIQSKILKTLVNKRSS